jgi:hypothetical protein
MRRLKLTFALIFMVASILGEAHAQTPPLIKGSPEIDSPKTIDWPFDFGRQNPNLNEPTANLLNDFHSDLSDCEMVLSTAGNYHMALKDLWAIYLTQFPADNPLKNWFYTTSPPVPKEQIDSGVVQFGNLSARCRPQVAVTNQTGINSLVGAGYTEGAAIPIVKNFGNVLLVRKGNPKNIQTIWDLGRPGVRIVTPNPTAEPGSFQNYSGSIYDIARLDPNPPPGMTAEQLFNSIFNETNGDPKKWLAGVRIHHRETPWSIAYGKADVGVIFYHLALYMVRNYPDQFEIVPLGGTVDNPEPLPGNRIATLLAVRIKGDNWTSRQLEAAEKLMNLFQSNEFTTILEQHGLRRP